MNKYTLLELLELLAERTKLPQDSILEALFNQAILTGGAYTFAVVLLLAIAIYLFYFYKSVGVHNGLKLLLIVGLIVSAAAFYFFQALSLYINTPYWIMKEMLDLLNK